MKMLRTLKGKTLVWYLMFVIIPFIAGVLILLHIGEANLKRNALAYMNLYSRQVENNLDKSIEEYDRLMKSTMADKEVCDLLEYNSTSSSLQSFENYKYIQQHFLKMITQQPQIEFIIILDNEKNIYPSLTYVSIPDLNKYLESILYHDIIDANGKAVISSGDFQQYALTTRKNTAISISRLLKNLDGKTIGVGSIILDTNDIIRNLGLASQNLQYFTGVVVLDQNNNIVIDTANYTKDGTISKDTLLSNPIGDNFLTSGNEEYMIIKHPQSRYGLTTIVCVPTASLFYDSNYYVTVILTILIIICLFASVFLYLFKVQVTEPIKKLDTLTHQISKGNFDIYTNIHSKDEIGSLAANFETMADKVKGLIKEVYIKDISQKQSELSALQNQINPHFLFNTLESIRMKAVVNSDTEVANMIRNLSRLFRITLDIKSNKTTLKAELQHVKAYVDIQNMRYDNVFNLQIDVPTELTSFPVIKLILQPIVENCILHGFGEAEKGGTIIIRAKKLSDNVIISIEDDGKGLDYLGQKRLIEYLNSDSQINSMQSIGLKNIYERIRLEYGGQGNMSFSSDNRSGFKVELTIPDPR